MESTNKVYSVSDDEFIQICENSISIRQINDKLGYAAGRIGTYTYQLIRKRISELKRPDLEEKFSGNQRATYKKKINSLSKEELKELVENSQTLSECLDKIGVELIEEDLIIVEDNVLRHDSMKLSSLIFSYLMRQLYVIYYKYKK